MRVKKKIREPGVDTKARINTWDCIKPKSFSTTKETIDKVKMQRPEWEETSANLISDKRLASKIHKEITPLNSKRANDFF